MSDQNPHQSIEDLIKDSRGEMKSSPTEKDTAQIKFREKQEEIKKKEIERLVSHQADILGIPYIQLQGFSISPEALMIMSEEDVTRLQTLCFYYDGTNIRFATIDPTEEVVELVKKISDEYRANPMLYLMSAYSLDYALKLFRTLPKVKTAVRGININEEELNKFSSQFSSFKDLQASITQASISDVVTMLIASSIRSDASDIHIEGEEKNIKVRFRIDGVLNDAASLEKDMWPKIISRLKLLAGVKLNVTNKPQDGRISIYMKDDHVDIRCSFLPTAFGESVVMRLLRSSSVGLGFEDLGLRGNSYERLKREVERPNGMIVTTGPTGSGKTTTLYAILKKLNDSETKIITIEDPIEYQLAGVNQSQTSEHYTFAQALRSIVRQDPDVIMVGEIRDLDTAEIAIQAALTGHLVLSTIHTNDASGTVPRFLSMGVKPYLLAPAVNAMIGQRLVRKVCQKCKEETTLSEEELKRVNDILDKLPEQEKNSVDRTKMIFYKGKGCDACQGLGFKGRVGIYEILTMNPEIEKLILSSNVSEYDMAESARKAGMITMVQDGVLKALEGLTSIDEVFRVAE